MVRLAIDGVRAILASFALVVLLFHQPTVSVIGQVPAVATADVSKTATPAAERGVDQVGSGEQITLLQWGIREGGAFVVILVILFFYRRDWKTAVDFWRDQHATTTELVVKATAAQSETAAALRENTVVVHNVKNVIQAYIPNKNRRLEDPQG